VPATVGVPHWIPPVSLNSSRSQDCRPMKNVLPLSVSVMTVQTPSVRAHGCPTKFTVTVKDLAVGLVGSGRNMTGADPEQGRRNEVGMASMTP